MHKTLFIIGLGLITISCGSQKNVVHQQATPKKTPANTTTTSKPTPTKTENTANISQNSGGNAPFFYKQNIGDLSKNDNTISWGSVVSAHPKGYQVSLQNFPSVAQNFRQRYLILHYTALDNDASVRVLTQRGVSAHYLVSDFQDHEIWQLVDENKRAYHAGISYWRNTTGMNDNSIGIEIVNRGYTADAEGNKQFYPFPEHQFRKVAALVKDIVTRYNIPPTQILAHSDIAPTRKQDPGPFFPWKRLYDEYQIGMWYDADTMQNFYATATSDIDYNYDSPSFIFKVQTAFKDFGYNITPTGNWDDTSKKVIEAFQYHFRPERCDGILDPETWAILQALSVKYPK
ncbi:N-acetylmuramoyl-L-alanine amidase [Riemerella columbina]|uniref:N-acetylmuramoyl-L-alanine amidase n=1 Tax=Riemerella columbina TaxID=103810 RepID=UPI00266F51F4|nr:N-acetylmuramoyl-L-alanine amidase [Riemerella columbina]WKS95811.1 N-acetylmuramoyl-L-alanine amidase [Riemerella columbina]